MSKNVKNCYVRQAQTSVYYTSKLPLVDALEEVGLRYL